MDDDNAGYLEGSVLTSARKLVSDALLDGTDLSGVVDFAESKWERSDWWKARCISQELLDYLEKHDATASPEDKQAGNAISCH